MYVNAFCGWFSGIFGNRLGVFICKLLLVLYELCALSCIGVIVVGWLSDGVGGRILDVLLAELFRFCIPWFVGILLLYIIGIVDESRSNLDVSGVFSAILKFPWSGSFLQNFDSVVLQSALSFLYLKAYSR